MSEIFWISSWRIPLVIGNALELLNSHRKLEQKYSLILTLKPLKMERKQREWRPVGESTQTYTLAEHNNMMIIFRYLYILR